eukprot:TRINITY_DN11705_c0_g1_i2.p1 TRINITY_DN11705_c0_g1~~TRINITY_DN11705_c0_g1_i2.p1  ORF type:complete len:116 (-),score=16.23 TRINITY_DN11705_c0_g1_i2:419-766(-)
MTKFKIIDLHHGARPQASPDVVAVQSRALCYSTGNASTSTLASMARLAALVAISLSLACLRSMLCCCGIPLRTSSTSLAISSKVSWLIAAMTTSTAAATGSSAVAASLVACLYSQ